MKLNTRFIFDQYEPVSEINSTKLVGGFSMSFSVDDTDDSDNDGSNNCLGGNCSNFCGDGQNIKCNATVGCG